MEMPEAGGSIRVGRTLEMPANAAHEEKDRIKALVVGVKRGDYPDVTLKLKVLSTPRAPELQKKLKKQSYVAARVAYATRNGQLDLGERRHPTQISSRRTSRPATKCSSTSFRKAKISSSIFSSACDRHRPGLGADRRRA